MERHFRDAGQAAKPKIDFAFEEAEKFENFSFANATNCRDRYHLILPIRTPLIWFNC